MQDMQAGRYQEQTAAEHAQELLNVL
jgi:hypothetical protein